MTYGLATTLFFENGPAVHVQMLKARTSAARNWRALDADRRLTVIDQALAPAGHPRAAEQAAA